MSALEDPRLVTCWRRALGIYTRDGVRVWWTGANGLLGGRSAAQVWVDDPARVEACLAAVEDGVFV